MNRTLLVIILLLFLGITTRAQLTITADGPLEFCSGGSVTLCVDSSYSTCLWNSGSINTCITILESGNYFPICLDSLGNIDSTFVDSAITVIVHDPQPTLYQIDGIVYLGEHWETYQWFHNGDSIPSATDSSYAINEYGNYWALVTDQFGCVASTDTFECTSNGCNVPMNTIKHDPLKFRLSPVPASNLIYVDISDSFISSKLQVFDSYGRQILNSALSNTRNSIDVRTWPDGVYFVSITTETGHRKTERVIVLHE